MTPALQDPASPFRSGLCAAALCLALATPLGAAAANCPVTNDTTIQQTPALACPNGTCPTGDQLDAIAENCVVVGADPPLSVRKELGASSFAGMGTATPGGFCPPGTNGLNNYPVCPTYSVAGNTAVVPNNGAGQSAFATGGTAIAPLGGTNILNAALNKATQALKGLLNNNNNNNNAGPSGNLPAAPCGGAVGLTKQTITLGNTTIGVPAAGLTTTATTIVNNIVGQGTCAGSTLALSTSEVSLIIAPTNNTTAVNNGQINTVSGDIINVPAGTAVTFNVEQTGTLSLPAGATFIGPQGQTVTLGQNSTLTSLGNGTVQLPNGTTLVYGTNSKGITNGTININTTAVGVPAGTNVSVDANGNFITPQS